MKYGDVISLGRHKLMCGDATSPQDVGHLLSLPDATGSDKEGGQYHVDLVLTDPPYGMKIQKTNGQIGGEDKYRKPLPIGPRNPHGKTFHSIPHLVMLGDDSQDTARKHYDIIKQLNTHMIIWGGQYFADFLPISGAWIFWDKLTGSNDFSDGELAYKSWGKQVKKYTHLWNGTLRAGTYKLNPRPRVHPTQKPVELHMSILDDFTKPGDIILDCFGGSGTTLIACEMTGRTCLMMEISPDYCDIIKQRYETLTAGAIPGLTEAANAD